MQSKKQGTILASDKFHESFSSMHSIKVNTYNPFTKSFLGFSFSSNFSNENYSFNLLDNLDLYHQPLEHPSTAISLFVARFLIIFLGELVLYKLFKMVRKENGLVNEVTQFYCIAFITNCPILEVINVTLKGFEIRFTMHFPPDFSIVRIHHDFCAVRKARSYIIDEKNKKAGADD